MCLLVACADIRKKRLMMCDCSINIPMFLLLWIQQNRYFNERYFETLRIFCDTENVLENVYHSSFH